MNQLQNNEDQHNWPLITFFFLAVLSLIISIWFPDLIAMMTDFLKSPTGDKVMPRIITAIIAALFVSGYVAERMHGRDASVTTTLLACLTTLSLAAGFYTLSRWLLLDVYGQLAAESKFMPHISSLDITALSVALIMLLIEISKQIANEIGKLKPVPKGIKVQPAE
jgi:uncharacterized membrane protein YhaH (DUF805 family)